MTVGEPSMTPTPHPPSSSRGIPGAIILALGLLVVLPLALRAGQAAPEHALYLPFTMSNRSLSIVPAGADFYTPTAVTHAGDGRIFVVERGGRLQILHPDGRETTFLNLANRVVSTPGENGLFDMAFHPGYGDPDSTGFGFFYVSYTGLDQGDSATFISRFRVSVDADVADPASETWIMKVSQKSIWHKGGELVFDPLDHALYVAVGDDGQASEAQLLSSPKGKIIRLRVDDVPPTATGDATGQAAMAFVAIGLRNPWRFDLDPDSRLLFIADVGENSWEEVNVMDLDDPMPNFGWPCREGPLPYPLYAAHPVCQVDPSLLTSPSAYHAHGEGYCAVIGGRFVRSPVDPPDGRYLYTDACRHDLFALSQVNGGWRSFRLGTVKVPGFITSIGEDVHGRLYLGTTTSAGPIYRLNLQ